MYTPTKEEFYACSILKYSKSKKCRDWAAVNNPYEYEKAVRSLDPEEVSRAKAVVLGNTELEKFVKLSTLLTEGV